MREGDALAFWRSDEGAEPEARRVRNEAKTRAAAQPELIALVQFADQPFVKINTPDAGPAGP
jgi:hypothetical protein